MKKILCAGIAMLAVVALAKAADAGGLPSIDVPSFEVPNLTTTIQSFVLSPDFDDYQAAANGTTTFIYGKAVLDTVTISGSGGFFATCIDYEKGISLKSVYFEDAADEIADIECESFGGSGSSCSFKCDVDSSWVEKATAASNAHGVASAMLKFEAVIPMGEGQTSYKMFGLDSIMAPDQDVDGVPDDLDNCPIIANTDQADKDHNGKGDACTPIKISIPIQKTFDWSKLHDLFGDDSQTTPAPDPAPDPSAADPASAGDSDEEFSGEESGDATGTGSLKFADNAGGCSMIPAAPAGSLSWLLVALAFAPMGFRRKRK